VSGTAASRAQVAICAIAGLVASGLAYWPPAYPKGPSMELWFALGVLAGLVSGWVIRAGWRAPWFSVTAGFVLAVMIRVGVEVTRGPTSHNLWPFEVGLALVWGLPSSIAGLALARLAQRILTPDQAS